METACLRSLLRLLIICMLLGYSMMWIMLPTKIYKYTWQPKLNARLVSTYFGTQEMTTLIFTLPALMAAILSCIYLHLGNSRKKSGGRSGEKRTLATWRKPMLVKGPLGIVTGIELAFLIMLVVLLAWSLYNYFNNSFKYITPATSGFEKVWELKLDLGGLWLGIVGNICLTLLFFPVARGSSVLPFFGLTSEGSIKYHIWLGHMVLIFFTSHGICYIAHWSITHQMSEALKWASITGISNVAGEISLAAGLALWATTFPRIRRKMFELFFYTHYLYIVFVVFFVFHVGFSYACYMLPSFYLFLVDRYLRFLQSRQRVRLDSSRILPGQTLELNFSKAPGLKYNPTSVMFLNVPSISKLQWHPFTITSNSDLESDKLSVVIKGEGNWTTKLYQMVSSPTVDRFDISVEGPYGPASTHFLRHETLVLVSGGSGITPFISILRELMHATSNLKLKTPQIILISSFKNSDDLTMLNLLLPLSESPSLLSHLDITIEAYVTQDTEPPTSNDKLSKLHARWFKPHETDVPISPTLGTNSWLWLASIISSSFTAFVIIVGVVGRYYIFPIDHNTDMVFSWSGRSVVTMLILCTCISVTASAAVVWNKRWSAKEAEKDHSDQKDGTGGSSRWILGSPAWWEVSMEREVENVTSIHYGKRPDLKRILFDCKGESIGVLASGPKKMRQDVAKICSCGLVKNLHFESISFSW
ncbi:Ferric reduction oxidase 2 [Linum perenne]